MKCKMNEEKPMMIMAIVGLVMLVLGGLGGLLLEEEQHLLMRLAGFFTGLGLSLTLMGIGVLVWRRAVGVRRAQEAALSMEDERGQEIAYRAQSVMALCAVASLVILIITALVRGDTLYMLLVSALCLFCAAAKFIAMHVYSKRM